jgi:hypothetical protein
LLPENSNKIADSAPGVRRSDAGGVRGDWIGKQLRSAYDSTLSEPLPPNLQDLVAKLMKQGIPSSGPGPGQPEDDDA